jgi:signal peptidase
MLYLELNANGTSYRCAALKNVPEIKWSTSNTLDTWDNLTNLVIIHDVGWNDIEITVDIRTMLMSQRSGFVTKGDHNSAVDPLATDHGPVDISWVVGKARGEIPWFGLLKLWTTDTLGSTAPSNSVRNLWITVAFIIVTPVIVDIFLTYREKRLVEEKRARSAQKSGKIAKIDKRVEAEGPKKPPE